MHQSVLKLLLYHIMYEHHHFTSLCHNTGQIWLGDKPIQTVSVWGHFLHFLMLQRRLYPSLHNTYTHADTHKHKYVGEGKSEENQICF